MEPAQSDVRDRSVTHGELDPHSNDYLKEACMSVVILVYEGLSLYLHGHVNSENHSQCFVTNDGTIRVSTP